jgi:hypothetical protein
MHESVPRFVQRGNVTVTKLSLNIYRAGAQRNLFASEFMLIQIKIRDV